MGSLWKFGRTILEGYVSESFSHLGFCGEPPSAPLGSKGSPLTPPLASPETEEPSTLSILDVSLSVLCAISTFGLSGYRSLCPQRLNGLSVRLASSCSLPLELLSLYRIAPVCELEAPSLDAESSCCLPPLQKLFPRLRQPSSGGFLPSHEQTMGQTLSDCNRFDDGYRSLGKPWTYSEIVYLLSIKISLSDLC